MKSQSSKAGDKLSPPLLNSQELKTPRRILIEFDYQPDTDEANLERFHEAESKLLQLALSCKTDGRTIVQPDLSKIPDYYHWVYFLGQKYAIDTMEQNIRMRFQ